MREYRFASTSLKLIPPAERHLWISTTEEEILRALRRDRTYNPDSPQPKHTSTNTLFHTHTDSTVSLARSLPARWPRIKDAICSLGDYKRGCGDEARGRD